MPEPYELEPEPNSPDLPGEVIVCATEEAIIDAAAADLFVQASACAREFGDFHLAIAGGHTVEKLCLRLMVDPMYRGLPWTKTQLWVAAETPGQQGPGGSVIVDEVLRHHAGIPRSQIHTVPLTDPDAHGLYEKEIIESLEWREKGHDRLDFVVLDLAEAETGVRIGWGEDIGGGRLVSRYKMADERERVCMTPWFVSGARFLALLASGARSRAAVRASMEDAGRAEHLKPLAGVQKWYIDRAAMGEGEA